MLKSTIADLESVDENLRSFYVEKDGKFILDVEPVDGFALENVGSLKKALAAERRGHGDATDALREAKARLDDFGGLDPKAARAALARVTAGPTEIDTAVEARVDALRAAIAETAGAEAKAARAERDILKATLGRREAQLQKMTRDAVISSELARARPIEDAVDMLALSAAQHVAMVEEEGELIARVIDSKGNTRLDESGKPMSVRAFMAEMKKHRPALFQAENTVSGLGTSPGGGRMSASSGEYNPWAKGSTNITQQIYSPIP